MKTVNRGSFLGAGILVFAGAIQASQVHIDGVAHDYVSAVTIYNDTLQVYSDAGNLVCTPGGSPVAVQPVSIVLDGYAYPMSYFQFGGSVSAVAATLSDCVGPMPTGDHTLIINNNEFVSTNQNFVFNQHLNALVVHSVNGDVVCDGGVYVGDGETIFNDAFESNE